VQALSPASHRFDRLDALRGLAIVWMAVFHFCYDLNHFRLLQPVQRFLSDPFWTSQRTAIVTLFLLCVGLGQAAALQAGQVPARFWRRWAEVAGCAALVSLGSWWMFGPRWIHFGVLHAVAVMLLVLRFGAAPLLRAAPRAGAAGLAGLALLALGLPRLWGHPALDARWATPLGLGTRLPATEDYVPLLPWLGVVLAGLLLGRWLLTHRPAWLRGAVPTAMAPLATLGRWSLSFYMLHQPVLFGALMAWGAWRGGFSAAAGG
jgi:uncharacterized membrane protein